MTTTLVDLTTLTTADLARLLSERLRAEAEAVGAKGHAARQAGNEAEAEMWFEIADTKIDFRSLYRETILDPIEQEEIEEADAAEEQE